MFKALLLAVLAVLAIAAAVNVPFTSCADGSVKILAMESNSWPPQKGGAMSTVTTADVSADITGGTFKVETKWSGMSVSTITGDVCEYFQDAQGNNLPCPIAAGNGRQWYNGGVFPTNAPNGAYEMKTTLVDQSGNTIFCFVNKFQI